MPAAHIAGIPVEETLLAFGGPAAIYAVLLGFAAAVRRALSRIRLGPRHHPGADR